MGIGGTAHELLLLVLASPCRELCVLRLLLLLLWMQRHVQSAEVRKLEVRMLLLPQRCCAAGRWEGLVLWLLILLLLLRIGKGIVTRRWSEVGGAAVVAAGVVDAYLFLRAREHCRSLLLPSFFAHINVGGTVTRRSALLRWPPECVWARVVGGEMGVAGSGTNNHRYT